jgi:hypothetical protein
MKEEITEFALYIWLIIKKFVIRILVPIGILDLLSRFGIIRVEIPAFIYWLIACIGLICVSFLLYKEQQKEVALGKGIIKLKRQAKIAISLTDSNKFSYILDDTGIALIRRELPCGNIILHTKLVNTSATNAEILSIKGRFNTHDLWFVDFQSLARDKDQKDLLFPISLLSHEKIFVDLIFPVEANPSLNQAQIKDRLVKHQSKETKLEYDIQAEYRDATGKTRSAWFKDKISTERLIELYLQKFHELEKMIASFRK